jgi:hypothetical protein
MPALAAGSDRQVAGCIPAAGNVVQVDSWSIAAVDGTLLAAVDGTLLAAVDGILRTAVDGILLALVQDARSIRREWT